jgi:protein TonB
VTEPRCPFLRPEQALVAPPRRRGEALGWVASGAAVALTLSGLAALAMQIAPGGAAGEAAEAMPILLAPPAPALGAFSEAAPEAAAEPPDPAAAPVADAPPALPQAAEAPPDPQTPAAPEPLAAEADPSPDHAAPPPPQQADLAEAEAPPDATPKPKPKPQKTAAKPSEPAEKPAKTAKAKKPQETAKQTSQASAEAAPAPKPAAKSAGAGKSSAASYARDVLKKITKTRKKEAGGKGVAVVSFTISGSGGLSALAIARSSGDGSLDRAALDHIRRSAPFPPPPPGAQTEFAFEFVGK